jgi:hypothetical protein
MSTPQNVFVTESNIDIYLSKLHQTHDPTERDVLVRLILEEQSRMGLSREHVENGERRVVEGRRRVEQQRLLVSEVPPPNRADHPAVGLLELMEKTQRLLEEHLKVLVARQREHGL